ncbi:hypothetical protein VSH64_07890 [Amycolatopsis rhabdoformis]|uniref:KAP NTPase domain-containing protein n=1 Tax=Amycolatopsis rhabdoformis TaxID=1448059 RepID=A0ABZ1IEQ9_9PSEU|nr:hypothetical protein [Amycolatopsis rhabdoformis]WSE32029.1 hypothetical protein VSH64_07890 [Amycolatopsis rhabdoformis]
MPQLEQPPVQSFTLGAFTACGVSLLLFVTLQDTLEFDSVLALALGLLCFLAAVLLTTTVRLRLVEQAREGRATDAVMEQLRDADFDDFDAWSARLVLQVLVDEAGTYREVTRALSEERVRLQDAEAHVLADESVVARIRIERDRLGRIGGYGASAVTSTLTSLRPGQYFRLAATAVGGVTYLSLMRAAWPRMPVPAHVLVILGFCAVAALSVSGLTRPGRDGTGVLNLVPRTEPHPDLLDIGDRREYLLTEVVVPAFLDYIRVHRSRRDGTTLVYGDVSGLDEGGGGETVMTAGAERLRRIIERTESGAVALAGSRGVGKTTAIEALRYGRLTTGGRQPLVVLASAPANYEARDFVLHLHALLCRTVIDRTGDVLRPVLRLDKKNRRAVLRQAAVSLAKYLVFTVVMLGAALLLWGVPLLDFLREIATLTTKAVADLPVSAGVLWRAQPVTHVIALVLIALVVLQLVRMVVLAPFTLLSRAAWRRRHHDLVELHRAATRQLAQTRFLQTHTTGWSGKLSLPLKGEAGRTWSTQQAEQQLTHPEVVEKLRALAGQTSATLREAGLIDRMVIAIDELDKIGEPEKAHQFINDIKGVFGVRGCMFFVSVSDDAVLNFEQRGLGIRDAFDSAFSEMVRLDHFTLEESRRWVASRVVGVTEQFCYLCHCLSGGLPRDLQRYAVEMVDVSTTIHEPSLATVTSVLVRKELSAKIHALTGLTAVLSTTAEHVALTARLFTISEVENPLELSRMAQDLVAEAAEDSLTETDVLRWNAGCLTLFCATLLEAFTDDLGHTELAAADFHQLAVARRWMAAHPRLAWQRIVDFRKARDLDADPPVHA